MQKLASTRLLTLILIVSLGGSAWFILHVQTSPREVDLRQEIPSQTGTKAAKLSPDPPLIDSHQKNQARIRVKADLGQSKGENDMFEEDPTPPLRTENELILGLIDSGQTRDQILTILYDPDSLPQPDGESELETLPPEERELENALAEGLRADRLSDSEIYDILHNPGSLPQPDSESGVTPYTAEELEAEDAHVERLRADGLGDGQIYDILHNPEYLPQAGSESGLETLTLEERKFEEQIVEGLRAEGLSDWQIDSILHDPESLSQPDDQITLPPTPDQRARLDDILEDAGLR